MYQDFELGCKDQKVVLKQHETGLITEFDQPLASNQLTRQSRPSARIEHVPMRKS